ncbi:MAG: hypothetical protein OEY81_03945 [Candidatus Bathyarchaeota archaeon]|nr:hypothetical protein [Candidatus Bathyarchaeota archaeon]
MSWEKESILILVKAAPHWSKKRKRYDICTAGVSETEGWRRLYPFPERNMIGKDVHVWDIIEVETKKPTDDPRPESRRIKPESIVKADRLEDRNERRKFLMKIEETSLEIPLCQKRTLTVIKPRIEDFKVVKRTPEPVQHTLEGKRFKIHPYGDVGLYYKWSCQEPCRYCKGKYHNMECFDWGANLLYTKYDEKTAKAKVKQKCLYEMKYDNDTWFALGTHSRRPWKKWMIVGLLWMKKKKPTEPSTKILSEFA